MAGCLGGAGDDAPTTTLDPDRVTTTGGDAIEVVVAQIVIRESDDGPHVHYRLRNDGVEDATLELRTVLQIESGGTYEATAYADVLAGEEAVVEYRLVRYDGLTGEERTNVRRGNADFELYVNGERSTDV